MSQMSYKFAITTSISLFLYYMEIEFSTVRVTRYIKQFGTTLTAPQI